MLRGEKDLQKEDYLFLLRRDIPFGIKSMIKNTIDISTINQKVLSHSSLYKRWMKYQNLSSESLHICHDYLLLLIIMSIDLHFVD